MADISSCIPLCREQVRESEQQVAAGRPFQAYLHGAPKPPCQAERWQTLQDIYKTQGGMVITDPDISASLSRERALRTPSLACVLHECSPLVLNAAHAAASLAERRCMVLNQNQLLLCADHLLNLACSVLQSEWAMITVLEDTTASLAGENVWRRPAALPSG
jgi:hypothetical protein